MNHSCFFFRWSQQRRLHMLSSFFFCQLMWLHMELDSIKMREDNVVGNYPNYHFIVREDGRFLVKKIWEGRRLIFGRNRECDVVLSDTSVSDMHLAVEQQGDRICAIDIHSKHGTYLDDMKLIAGQPKRLHVGQSLRLGTSKIEVEFCKRVLTFMDEEGGKLEVVVQDSSNSSKSRDRRCDRENDDSSKRRYRDREKDVSHGTGSSRKRQLDERNREGESAYEKPRWRAFDERNREGESEYEEPRWRSRTAYRTSRAWHSEEPRWRSSRDAESAGKRCRAASK